MSRAERQNRERPRRRGGAGEIGERVPSGHRVQKQLAYGRVMRLVVAVLAIAVTDTLMLGVYKQ